MAATPEMRGKITFEEKPLPFPNEVDGAPLARIIGPLLHIPHPRAWPGQSRFRELVGWERWREMRC